MSDGPSGTDPEANIYITGKGTFKEIPPENIHEYDKARQSFRKKGAKGDLLSTDDIGGPDTIEKPGPNTPVAG